MKYKNYSILFLLILLFSFHKSVQSQNETVQGRELKEYLAEISNFSKSKIKILKVTEFAVVNNQPEKTGTLYMEKDFNTDGTVSKEMYYNDKGELNRKIVSKYNESKLTVEKLEFFPNGSIDRKYSFSYDKAGNKLEELKLKPFYQGFSNERRFSYEYDEKGMVLTESGFGPDGSTEWKSEYTYDAKGFPKEKSMFTAEGDLVWKDMYTCDANGYIIKTKRFDMDGKVISEIDQEFDNAGYILVMTKKNSEGKVLQKYTSVYNANHILQQKTVYSEEDKTTTLYKYEYQNF